MRVIAPIALWACVSAVAATAETPVDLSPPVGPRGRPSRVVKPEYPPDALARGQTGAVTLEGVAGPDGRFNEINFIPDRPESGIFVEAVAKVTPRWEFRNPYGPDCMPLSVPFRTEVEFRIENGVPGVIVTHAPADEPPPKPLGPPAKPATHFKPVHRVNPVFPGMLAHFAHTGKTFAKIVVDREGSVASVDTRTYDAKPSPNSRQFDVAAQTALKMWKFPPVPPEEKAPWTGCYEIAWKLRD
jgi:hypothetical protein